MKNQVHLIGNAHLDPVWLWRYQEGFAEIKATFQSALDRIEQFDDFIFTSACASYYKWVEENAPEMFKKIQEAVKSGKWSIAGGMWIQPDCNIPSGESFARQLLYSQRYFLEKFGLIAEYGYNVDSFGHNANLPQLLSKAGIKAYVYMRPGKDFEKKYPFDQNLFWWESMDKSKVLTYRIHEKFGYGTNTSDDVCGFFKDLADKQSIDVMLFYGVGNHGGGPTVKMIKNLLNKQKESTFIFSNPEKYFEKMYSSRDLPTLTGDLQHHASGCYSANSMIKKKNRLAENRLTAAEKCSVMSNILSGYKYDNSMFFKAWENVMFNQFHDIMGGCSIKEAYQDAEEFFGQSLAIGSKSLNSALQSISWNIDTAKTVKYLSKDMDWTLWEQGELGTPIVVYNPLSWPVKIPVIINRHQIGYITDTDGNILPHQTIRASQTNGREGSFATLFTADVPAMGYTTFWAYINGKNEKGTNNGLKFSKNFKETSYIFMENKYIRLEFDTKTGYISSFYNKETNTEFIKSCGAKPIVINDEKNDTWAHGVFNFEEEIGDFKLVDIIELEMGPVRLCFRVIHTYETSTVTQDFYIYPDSKDVEVSVRIQLNEKYKIIKFTFDTDIKDPKAIYEIPYGFIEKCADGMEEPTQNWGAVEGEGKGFAVLNGGKYSYSVKGSELRFIAARSCVYADHFGVHSGMRDENYEIQDLGIQNFKYVIKGYNGSFKENGIVKRGWELNTEFLSITETYHKGNLFQKMAGVEITAENILLSTMKNSEDENGYIIRLYETSGFKTETNISIPWLDINFKTVFDPCEIKTFKIMDDKVVETDILEFKR